MANVYGPIQFRPNPSGLTLNSSPVSGFQPPAPVAAPVAAAPQMPSTRNWIMGLLKEGLGAQRAVNRGDKDFLRSQVDRFPQIMGGMVGRGQPQQAAAPVQGPLSLDPTALAFMNYLNRRP